MPSITRHDFTATQRDVLNAAVSIGLTDAVGLAVMIANHGANALAIFDDLDAVAEAMRHSNSDIMSEWCRLRDAVAWLEHDALDPDRDDRFGFAADARAKAQATVDRHLVRIGV